MATMLNGAAVMDGALLLVAANETCPQPQTSEHLAAIEIMRLQHILILQNKIDLIRCLSTACLWAAVSAVHRMELWAANLLLVSSKLHSMCSYGTHLKQDEKQLLRGCLWDLPGPPGRLATAWHMFRERLPAPVESHRRGGSVSGPCMHEAAL